MGEVDREGVNTGRDIFGEFEPFWDLGFGLYIIHM